MRIVAFGGGTGLPMLLHGLKDRVEDLTAVVTIADDGGSSGRLRQELGVMPPGDVRNCLVALARRRSLAEVFTYRFAKGKDLRDHSLGNLIIAALTDMGGGFCEGVERAARFLHTKGRVYPAAVESLTLTKFYADGTVVKGQSNVGVPNKPILRVTAEPAGAMAPSPVLKAIERADAVVLSAGSLFTSTIPSLLGAGTRKALKRFAGPVIYVANIMTQPGETTGFAVSDHLRAIMDHVGPLVTDVLVHSGGLPREVVERYRAEGMAPVAVDREEIWDLGVEVREADLISEASPIGGVRHDSGKLAEKVCEVALVRLYSGLRDC